VFLCVYIYIYIYIYIYTYIYKEICTHTHTHTHQYTHSHFRTCTIGAPSSAILSNGGHDKLLESVPHLRTVPLSPPIPTMDPADAWVTLQK